MTQIAPGLRSRGLAYEGNSGLLLRFFGRLWLRRKLQDCCDLSFVQPRQQNYLTIGQLKGVVMHVRDILVYLPKASSALEACRNVCFNRLLKSDFCSGQKANCRAPIVWRAEPASTRTEIACYEFLADLCCAQPNVR
jgi:hypothetical protein